MVKDSVLLSLSSGSHYVAVVQHLLYSSSLFDSLWWCPDEVMMSAIRPAVLEEHIPSALDLSALFTLESTLKMSSLAPEQHPRWLSQAPLEIQEVCAALSCLHEWPDGCQCAPGQPHNGRFAATQTSVFWKWKAANITVGRPLADTRHHFSSSICSVWCQRRGITPLSLCRTSALG